MTLPSYAWIAQLVDTKAQPAQRRPTRTGIRRYLMAVAATKPLSPPSAPSWYRLWQQIEWTRRMTHALHITIPPKLWAEDRARLAAKLVVSVDDIRFMEEKERALRWTRRRSHA